MLVGDDDTVGAVDDPAAQPVAHEDGDHGGLHVGHDVRHHGQRPRGGRRLALGRRHAGTSTVPDEDDEDDEGDEGDEGHEGHEGDEGDEGDDHRPHP